MITWNRSGYVRKTIEQLLSNPEPFKLYCWDNNSGDETRGIIADIKDERVISRHYHKENVNQDLPVRWFLENASDGLVGKIDDDVLLPTGWINRLSDCFSSDEQIGMLGCWIFMPEDYLPEVASINAKIIGKHCVLRTIIVAGHSFLARRSVLQKYLKSPVGSWGIPLDRDKMSLDGFTSGYPLPLILAHNMDDPRSEHCMMNNTGLTAPQSSLTARNVGFKSLEEYANWIRADAIRRQVIPYEEQIQLLRKHLFRHTLLGRCLHRIERIAMRS